jgi:predicted TIM-barrel fold metal-dependent hydrolase
MALIVHLEPGRFYGPAEVEFFLDSLASAAPDVTIQIAHLAGNGPGLTSPEALEAFAKAREAGDPRTRNLYFDFAGLVYKGMGEHEAALMAQRMRQIGLDRILFASDASPGTSANPSAAQHWNETRRRLPLTDEELLVIARNLAPYIPVTPVRSPD